MERRLALAVSADLVAGQLLVVGDPAADVITLDHSGATTTVAGRSFPDSAITQGLLIQAGGGDDTFKLRGSARPVRYQGQQGRDTVRVGKDGNARDVQGPLEISNNFVAFLSVDDQADTAGRSVILDAVDDVNGTGTLSGLTPCPIRFAIRDIGGLAIFAGSGYDTFDVRSVRRRRSTPRPTARDTWSSWSSSSSRTRRPSPGCPSAGSSPRSATSPT